MNNMLKAICGKEDDVVSSGDEIEDKDAIGLTHVGTAAYDCLRRSHNWHHHSLWNVTSGRIIGKLHQTPKDGWDLLEDPEEGHDDWLPEKMADILAKTERFADVMSLAPPDGLFMKAMQNALKKIAERENKDQTVRIRMMFGNIIGMPVNCDKLVRVLTKYVPRDSKVLVWVGAWRKGVSWNHAKIIAVDGKFLHTGGHNMWDYHYLKHNPVHDLSLELRGRVAHDGHFFANEQWEFIESIQTTIGGACISKLPDFLPMATRTRVTVSEFPEGLASTFPPKYKKSLVPRRVKGEKDVPIITIGRYASLLHKTRPSDDAIFAMLESAEKIIRMALQDLGPVCIPGTKKPLPGCVWPAKTLEVLAKVIWEKGVDVEIVLSNPQSIPGGLNATEACYGNGWSCVDVAAEIIKSIKKHHPEAEDDQLRTKVKNNLRICFIRQKRGNQYEDGTTVGLHSKHFIVDDVSTYIGSQNLYICDLAEWGVVIDDEESTKQMMEEYWNPMWAVSFLDIDVDVQDVMDGLDVDRDGPPEDEVSEEDQAKSKRFAQLSTILPPTNEFYEQENE